MGLVMGFLGVLGMLLAIFAMLMHRRPSLGSVQQALWISATVMLFLAWMIGYVT